MKKHWLSAVILAVIVLTTLVPAVLAPAQAEASARNDGSWMVYTPYHPNGCAPLPYDCFVIIVEE